MRLSGEPKISYEDTYIFSSQKNEFHTTEESPEEGVNPAVPPSLLSTRSSTHLRNYSRPAVAVPPLDIPTVLSDSPTISPTTGSPGRPSALKPPVRAASPHASAGSGPSVRSVRFALTADETSGPDRRIRPAQRPVVAELSPNDTVPSPTMPEAVAPNFSAPTLPPLSFDPTPGARIRSESTNSNPWRSSPAQIKPDVTPNSHKAHGQNSNRQSAPNMITPARFSLLANSRPLSAPPEDLHTFQAVREVSPISSYGSPNEYGSISLDMRDATAGERGMSVCEEKISPTHEDGSSRFASMLDREEISTEKEVAFIQDVPQGESQSRQSVGLPLHLRMSNGTLHPISPLGSHPPHENHHSTASIDEVFSQPSEDGESTTPSESSIASNEADFQRITKKNVLLRWIGWTRWLMRAFALLVALLAFIFIVGTLGLFTMYKQSTKPVRHVERTASIVFAAIAGLMTIANFALSVATCTSANIRKVRNPSNVAFGAISSVGIALWLAACLYLKYPRDPNEMWSYACDFTDTSDYLFKICALSNASWALGLLQIAFEAITVLNVVLAIMLRIAWQRIERKRKLKHYSF